MIGKLRKGSARGRSPARARPRMMRRSDGELFVVVDERRVDAELEAWVSSQDGPVPTDAEVQRVVLDAYNNPANWMNRLTPASQEAGGGRFVICEVDPEIGRLVPRRGAEPASAAASGRNLEHG